MLDPEFIREIDFSSYKRIGVAYSGGVDSTVLIHFLSLIPDCKKKLFALHVNHGISSKSDLWEEHCKNNCLSLEIDFVSLKLESKTIKNPNENELRKARYKELFSWSEEGDVICTAHHKDDQVETILFRILRGTGIKGLEGIKKFSKRKDIDLIRPFLDFSKEDLIKYAKQNNLSWVEDDSNNNLLITRNYLRNKVLPLLAKKWPQYSDSFTNLSTKAQDASKVIEELSYSDLNSSLGDSKDHLSILKMKGLSKERIKNLMHTWLNQLNEVNIPLSFIEQAYRNIFLSKEDSNPLISFGKPEFIGSFQLRRFNNHIYFLPLLDPILLKSNDPWNWNINKTLELPTGVLSSKKVFGKGLSSEISRNNLKVKARSGGERCKPFGRSKSQKLKKLFQEYKIPPWTRDRLPLIYLEEELVAVADLWVCQEFMAHKNEDGFLLNWLDNLEKPFT